MDKVEYVSLKQIADNPKYPFDSFPKGFFGYVKKSEFIKAITNKTRNPAES